MVQVERAELVAFCRREHPRLVGALSLYCGDRDVAAEVAQEALIRAVEAWPRLQTMDAPGAWVHRVGMNLAASRFRRRSAERRALARRRDVAADPDVEAALDVRRAVADLPERQRRIIVLRYFLGYPLPSAARTAGISEQAAAALTYRAIRTLRARLDLPDTVEVGSDGS
jgi:RNA polymerase sigma factor (sigma-70 family)